MHISDAGGQTVATDLMTMFSSIDTALLDVTTFASSIMQMNAASTIPPAKLQPSLDSVGAGFMKLIEVRKDMVQSHRKLSVLKGESDQRETNWGCWRLAEIFFGEETSAPVAQVVS